MTLARTHPVLPRTDLPVSTCVWIAHRERHQGAIRLAATDYAEATRLAASMLECGEAEVCLRYCRNVTATRAALVRMLDEPV